MLLTRRFALRTLASTALAAVLALPLTLSAQTSASTAVTAPVVANRITQPIDENSRVSLSGTVHPLARAANDRGAAPDSMPLDRLQLVLKRSDAQETALRQRIADMHTPGSANYHKWLTPDQFGQQFGPSDADIATLESWLAEPRLRLHQAQSRPPDARVLRQRRPVPQHLPRRDSPVSGERRGPLRERRPTPQIPAALASVVGGFSSLNNFRVRSHSKTLGQRHL